MVDYYTYALNLGLTQRALNAEAALQDAMKAFEMAKSRIEGLECELAEMSQRAMIAEADGAGRKAQVEALKAQHPDSPQFQDSGAHFRSGKAKSWVRIAYEIGFDKVAKAWGISNPASLRAD